MPVTEIGRRPEHPLDTLKGFLTKTLDSFCAEPNSGLTMSAVTFSSDDGLPPITENFLFAHDERGRRRVGRSLEDYDRLARRLTPVTALRYFSNEIFLSIAFHLTNRAYVETAREMFQLANGLKTGRDVEAHESEFKLDGMDAINHKPWWK